MYISFCFPFKLETTEAIESKEKHQIRTSSDLEVEVSALESSTANPSYYPEELIRVPSPEPGVGSQKKCSSGVCVE